MFIVLDIYLHLQQLFDYPYPTLNKNQENTARFGFLVLNETMCLFYKMQYLHHWLASKYC